MSNPKFEQGQRIEILDHPTWERGTFQAYVDSDKAEVHFRNPRRPTHCSACGSFASLSRNLGTGEIQCMRTGCGHEHGFDTIVETLPLSQIQPMEKIGA